MTGPKAKVKKQIEKQEPIIDPATTKRGKACWNCGKTDFKETAATNGMRFLMCECGASQ